MLLGVVLFEHHAVHRYGEVAVVGDLLELLAPRVEPVVGLDHGAAELGGEEVASVDLLDLALGDVEGVDALEVETAQQRPLQQDEVVLFPALVYHRQHQLPLPLVYLPRQTRQANRIPYHSPV